MFGPCFCNNVEKHTIVPITVIVSFERCGLNQVFKMVNIKMEHPSIGLVFLGQLKPDSIFHGEKKRVFRISDFPKKTNPMKR